MEVAGIMYRLLDYCTDARNLWLWQEGIPQGLKPLFIAGIERPKAEALGYLEARTKLLQQQILRHPHSSKQKPLARDPGSAKDDN
jgi:hypothetical protein